MAFPIVNPGGFEQVSRYLPYSSEDLNRLFPGNERGSLGERIAAIIFNKIVEDKPALVLDLHNDWIRSIPYTLLDRDYSIFSDQEAVNKLNDHAFILGFPVVVDNERIPGSLSGMLLKAGIPALTLELGASNYVSEINIERGVAAISRLFKDIGVLRNGQYDQTAERNMQERELLLYSQSPLSSTSGIIRFYTGAGDRVKKGQMIAKIYNAFGKMQEVLNAENDGLVLGCSDHSLAFPGFPVMAFGLDPLSNKKD